MKKRRMRSGMAESGAETAKMPLAEIEAEIVRCHQGYQHSGTAQGRKAFFKRLVWLEAQREALFGIPAPPRAWR